jgi:toxin ParE1/3/4
LSWTYRGLRSWPLERYPHLIFYIERATHVEVWRVLNGKRDIPAWLLSDDSAFL